MQTKVQLIEYLRNNKQYLNISAIAKASGVSNLSRIVNDIADGRGYPPTLADKHVDKLNEVINLLTSPH